MIGKCDVAIVIPVFNEQDTIGKVLTDIDRSLRDTAIVYLVADSPNDPTLAAAEMAAVSLGTKVCFLIQSGEHGPASAIKLGIEFSTEKYVVFMTADDSDDARDIPKLISLLKTGASVACASRYAKGGQHLGGPRIKHFLSWLAGQFVYHVKRLNTCDPTNLFKAVKRNFLDEIVIESKFGFTLGLELVGKANVASLAIVEIPTIWHERTIGGSNFKTLKWIPTYLYWFLRVIFSK